MVKGDRDPYVGVSGKPLVDPPIWWPEAKVCKDEAPIGVLAPLKLAGFQKPRVSSFGTLPYASHLSRAKGTI